MIMGGHPAYAPSLRLTTRCPAVSPRSIRRWRRGLGQTEADILAQVNATAQAAGIPLVTTTDPNGNTIQVPSSAGLTYNQYMSLFAGALPQSFTSSTVSAEGFVTASAQAQYLDNPYSAHNLPAGDAYLDGSIVPAGTPGSTSAPTVVTPQSPAQQPAASAAPAPAPTAATVPAGSGPPAPAPPPTVVVNPSPPSQTTNTSTTGANPSSTTSQTNGGTNALDNLVSTVQGYISSLTGSSTTTSTDLISGVPNWVLVVGGVVLAAAMFTGGGGRK